ncbi:class I SAM-dependent methyltransferase [Olivibacter ginsenosidimutans]|uniref:Class I SAM-dependent methyltransferase n=1 Tax=Olivibacter ginsenosidimutans TaxID=1176537 RepID=A0ABP9BVT9_9SPHI
MAKVKPALFEVLHDTQVETVLMRLYKAALRQGWQMLWHFLPKVFQLLGKGIDWKTEEESFYKDKYIPILPDQGTFLYLQARAISAQHILEFGTSYGISTIYLAKAAKDNGGKVISTEYLPHKVQAARKHLEEAGLSDWVEILEGDARETLKENTVSFDMVLLDGWPDMVYTIFKLVEPRLKKGAIILVDDVEGFRPSMQDYLDYVRNPVNGYLSSTISLRKGLEYTVKT